MRVWSWNTITVRCTHKNGIVCYSLRIKASWTQHARLYKETIRIGRLGKTRKNVIFIATVYMQSNATAIFCFQGPAHIVFFYPFNIVRICLPSRLLDIVEMFKSSWIWLVMVKIPHNCLKTLYTTLAIPCCLRM